MFMRIEFPNEGRYARHGIELRCLALGRNGVVNAKALEVCELDSVVTLSPVTSKGAIGRCYIELPSSPATLRELAQRLLEVAGRKHKGKA